MSDHWHVPKVDWLATLPAAAANALRRASTVRTYRPGEPVFEAFRHPRHVYVLEAGLVRIFRIAPTGVEFTLGYVRPGELFGEVAVLGDRPREAFAVAKVASRIWRIPREAFVATLRAHNPVFFEVTKRIARRVLTLQSRAEDLIFLDARARLARLLVRLAREHGQLQQGTVTIAIPLTQEELGTLVGAGRQTVSALLRDMAAARLIERRRGGLVLLDPPGMEAIGWPDGRVRPRSPEE